MNKKHIDDIEELAVVGIDIGKDTFHLVGFDDEGSRVLRLKIKRLDFVPLFRKFPNCIVGMEACLSAHFVSRTLRGLGFESRIIPAIYVKPFNKGQKNSATANRFFRIWKPARNPVQQHRWTRIHSLASVI